MHQECTDESSIFFFGNLVEKLRKSQILLDWFKGVKIYEHMASQNYQNTKSFGDVK